MQGAVNPDEFYVYKPALRGRAGRRSSSGASAARPPRWSTPTTPTVGQDDRVRRRRPGRARRLLSLTDDEVEELARQALTIEEHYGRPMDIEWGKDGLDGELYILQARPETVQSRQPAASVQRYRLTEQRRPVLVEGRAIGQKIGAGAVRVLTVRRADARVRRRATCWSPT